MAQASTQPIVDYEFINANKLNPTTSSAGTFLSTGAYASIFGLRGALSTYDPFTYTEEELNRMTTNDMVFALRNIEDPTTIADYMTAQAARTA